MIKDRRDAARRLAHALGKYAGQRPFVPTVPRGVARVRPWCDEIVALAAPHDLYGVSVFYGDFRPVIDDEVVRLLKAPPVSAPE